MVVVIDRRTIHVGTTVLCPSASGLDTDALVRFSGVIVLILFELGTPYYVTLGSGWQKFSDGLFESLASRASGSNIFTITSLAPSTK